MAGASPVRLLHEAHADIRRGQLRRRLQAVSDGKSETAPDDLREEHFDPSGLVEEITAGHSMQSARVQRLVLALRRSGAIDRIVARLAEKRPQERVRSARIIGALRMYEAVPALAEMLDSRDRSVADAGARALGRIAGRASAEALVKAIHRRGLNRRLVAELARSAPDLYVEAALREPQPQSVRPALAIAAGLRRRRAAVAPLLDLLERGSRRERVISCRSLGWIGAPTAIPTLRDALRDGDWKIRMSAAKSLGAMRAGSAVHDLKYLQIDRNPKVRKAAANALRRLGPAVKEAGRGA